MILIIYMGDLGRLFHFVAGIDLFLSWKFRIPVYSSWDVCVQPIACYEELVGWLSIGMHI